MRPAGGFRLRTVVAVALFALVFIGESVYSYTQKSATNDEPVHVTDGYFSLARGDYRFDPEHPPLVRMWAALPLLFESVAADTRVVDASVPDQWAIAGLFHDAHRFLYLQNDADRLLYQARFMIVLLGVLLGVLLFAWVEEWLGFVPACAALAMLALEPNIVAHFSLVTTDGGLTSFAFGAVYFLWRICRRGPTAGNSAGLCLFCVLAATAKYSSILLFPAVLLLLALAVRPFRRLTLAKAATIAALVLVTSYVGLWASYRFQYLPSANATWTFALHDNADIAERVPTLTALVKWVDSHRLLPNVFSEGLLLGQAKSQRRFVYLAGRYSDTGWWYYFPFAMAIKTPLPLLLLIVWGSVHAVARRRLDPLTLAFLGVPIVFFMGGAMQSHLNIGLRHVLTVYPFLVMLAALAVAVLLETPRPRARLVLGALLIVWLFEYGRVYPSPLAFFNTLVGGPANGSQYLVDSNIDWGQDLKGLKAWMDEHDVSEISLSYFGEADPAYYGIKAIYLNGGPSFVPYRLISDPKVPGYVAISVSNLVGVFFSEENRRYYEPLRAMTPVAAIGHSINVYRVEEKWWQAAGSR
jgi:hypothetical protein